MFQPQENEQMKLVANRIFSRLNDYEMILGILFLISLILKSVTNAPLSILVVISLLGLASLYFFSGFAALNDENAGGIEIFLHKLSCWALSVCLIGILYFLQRWKFSDLFLLVGSITSLACLAGIIWIRKNKPEIRFFTAHYIVRIVVFSVTGLFIFFFRFLM